VIRPSRQTGKTRGGTIGELRLRVIYFVYYQWLEVELRQAGLRKKPGCAGHFA